tara:strand:+ start:498 stop:770 length:273 start_codon:yes stop_codon:yes gene_type:complete
MPKGKFTAKPKQKHTMKQITLKLTEIEMESLIHVLCDKLDGCDALNSEDKYRDNEAHKEPNSILDKLIAAGASKENFQAWGRRWDQTKRK